MLNEKKQKQTNICNTNYSESSSKSVLKFNVAFFIWLSAALFYLFQFVLRSSIGSISDKVMQDLNISASMFALLSSSYYISYTISQFPIGYLLDKFGHKKIFRISVLSCLIGAVMLYFSSGLFTFWLSRLIIGFGGSCAFIGCATISHALFTERMKPLFIGSIGGMGKMGGIIAGGPLVSLIGTEIMPTWRSMYAYMAIFGGIVAIMIWIFMINKSDIEKCVHNSAKIDKKPLHNPISAFKILIKSKKLWIVALYAGLTYVPMSVFADAWAMIFMKNKFMISSTEASYAVSVIFVGSFIGSSFIIPFLCNFFSKKMILIITTFLSFLVFMLLIYANISYYFALFLMCMVGVLYGSHAFVWLYSSDLFPSLSSTASGFVNGINMFFGMAFQPIVGFIMDLCGYSSSIVGQSNMIAFYFGMSIMPISMLIGGILTFYMQSTKK